MLVDVLSPHPYIYVHICMHPYSLLAARKGLSKNSYSHTEHTLGLRETRICPTYIFAPHSHQDICAEKDFSFKANIYV
jgi:hypothetical protein